MKERIGELAGKVWKILKEKEEINIERLPRMLKERSVLVYQALGWLARENKLEYHVKGGKTFVSLTGAERAK